MICHPMTETQEGFLLISDISGYTMYLNESELEHAQETLTALLELMVDKTQPPLIISRLEGDAVISYGLTGDFFSGQTFVELIENTYVAFRKAIERMVLNNTCQCRACANVNQLDLKFFTHYGTFGVQTIKDHQELVGSDVNLIHRLLKNSVRESTGFQAYALFTEQALDQLDLHEIRSTMAPHTESYPHIGELRLWVQDMGPIWKAEREAVQVELPEEQLVYRLDVELDMPPELVWDYLSDPHYRRYLHGSDHQKVLKRTGGRIGQGSTYQCFHGDKVVPQTILEWKPFELVVTRDLAGIPIPGTYYYAQYRLRARDGGTLLELGFTSGKGPLLGRLIMRAMNPMIARVMKGNIERFKDEVETDSRNRETGPVQPAGSE